MKRSLRSMTALPVGFFSVFDGLKMTLTTKGLRRFLIFPFVLNILLLGFCLYGAVEYLYPLLQSILPQGGAWYLALLRYLAKPLFILATMIITALAYSISGMIICAPFADPLSEKVEYLRTGRRVDSPISFAR
ncbi:MAG TPA: EI24 domain-containing protein, partial [Spirochaetota bacterium]